MKPNIAFDIDGIVAKFAAPFQVWADQKYGFTFTEQDGFHWSSDQGIPDRAFMAIIAEFIRENSDLIRPDLAGASLVNYVWNATKRPITFITARDYSTVGATDGWMRHWFPHIDFVCITVKSGKDKWRYLDDFGVFVEDRRRTAVDLAGIGKMVIMPARKYNRLDSGEYMKIIADRDIDVVYKETVGIKNYKTIVLTSEVDDIIQNTQFDTFLFKD